MTTPRPAAGAQDDARECSCPPQVERCAHFDNGFVALSTGHRCWRLCGGAKFGVFFSTETGPCPVCGCAAFDAFEALCLTDDYDAALAAFRDAEARLLGGAP